MTDERENGKADRGLKKLFSSLPRVVVPDDFEARVKRKIASRAHPRPGERRRFSAFAIPVLSLVVVGGVAMIIYLAPFGGGEPVRNIRPSHPAESPPPADRGLSPQKEGKGIGAPGSGEQDRLESRQAKAPPVGRNDVQVPAVKKEAPAIRGKNLPRPMDLEEKPAEGISPAAGGVAADSLLPHDSTETDSSSAPSDSTSVNTDSTGGSHNRPGRTLTSWRH